MVVRPVTLSDAAAWARMRAALWRESRAGEHVDAVARYFAAEQGMPLEVLLAVDAAGAAIGFAELSIRACAEDCVTDLDSEVSAAAHRAFGFDETVQMRRCLRRTL